MKLLIAYLAGIATWFAVTVWLALNMKLEGSK